MSGQKSEPEILQHCCCRSHHPGWFYSWNHGNHSNQGPLCNGHLTEERSILQLHPNVRNVPECFKRSQLSVQAKHPDKQELFMRIHENYSWELFSNRCFLPVESHFISGRKNCGVLYLHIKKITSITPFCKRREVIPALLLEIAFNIITNYNNIMFFQLPKIEINDTI